MKPQPEARPCINYSQCQNQEYMSWNKKTSYWQRFQRCNQCAHLWKAHKITPEEKDKIFATGCSIQGCSRPPAVIDHDHSICPQVSHSCDKCRRGPLCHHHNHLTIAVIDDLRAGKLTPELDYLGVTINFKDKE